MAKALPLGCRGMVAVARNGRGADRPDRHDFGSRSPVCSDGSRLPISRKGPVPVSPAAAKLREGKKRIRLLEREIEILRRALVRRPLDANPK